MNSIGKLGPIKKIKAANLLRENPQPFCHSDQRKESVLVFPTQADSSLRSE
jgi:hypothetical protein